MSSLSENQTRTVLPTLPSPPAPSSPLSPPPLSPPPSCHPALWHDDEYAEQHRRTELHRLHTALCARLLPIAAEQQQLRSAPGLVGSDAVASSTSTPFRYKRRRHCTSPLAPPLGKNIEPGLLAETAATILYNDSPPYSPHSPQMPLKQEQPRLSEKIASSGWDWELWSAQTHRFVRPEPSPPAERDALTASTDLSWWKALTPSPLTTPTQARLLPADYPWISPTKCLPPFSRKRSHGSISSSGDEDKGHQFGRANRILRESLNTDVAALASAFPSQKLLDCDSDESSATEKEKSETTTSTTRHEVEENAT